ncbi:hypothetical protein VTO42DRAFT_3490 [Malbranchea cinnamomea]
MSSFRGGIPPAERPISLAVRPPPLAKNSDKQPTPPLTPVSPADAVGASFSQSRPATADVETDTKPIAPPEIFEIDEFEYDIELERDENGEPLEFGRGAWSVVHPASSRGIPTRTGRQSPPPSPERSRTVFAVKSPLRADARPLLKKEARLLTRLLRIPGNKLHLVPFHGYIPESNSLVMTAVPLSLSDYIQSQASVAQKTFSTKTMFDPMLGTFPWLRLSEQLVEGLQWLHSCAQVVHGDLKPHNIRLRPRAFCGNSNVADVFPFDPLFADFTSSHDRASRHHDPEHQNLALSALTPPFVAPELLTVSSLTSADAVPSTSSDIFSLAVTLLAAATGDLILYPCSGNMQLLAMSREGHRIIDHVRSGPHCSRVPRNGIVEKILSPAFLRKPNARIQPSEWLRLIARETDELRSTKAV